MGVQEDDNHDPHQDGGCRPHTSKHPANGLGSVWLEYFDAQDAGVVQMDIGSVG